jgi:hypothetical protein
MTNGEIRHGNVMATVRMIRLMKAVLGRWNQVLVSAIKHFFTKNVTFYLTLFALSGVKISLSYATIALSTLE